MISVAPMVFVTLSIFLTLSEGHGLMNYPNPRGTLGGGYNLRAARVPLIIDPQARDDYKIHFPAGNKMSITSHDAAQRKAAGTPGWVPFEPLKPGFIWRAGVCGDERGKQQDHMRGGTFYHGGAIVRNYTRGEIIEVGLSIAGHHNGFIELHVCDVSRCGGEISENCFKQGYCRQLRRARNAICDSGNSKKCGPLDRNYPGRWYLPCSTAHGDSDWEYFKPNTIRYELPENLTCEHCVLQWFWSTAHTCNPPGVLEYFGGPDAPGWGQCFGQGGARGGVSRVQRPCGGTSKFAQEYLLCADIGILSPGRRKAMPKDERMTQFVKPTPILKSSETKKQLPRLTESGTSTDIPPSSKDGKDLFSPSGDRGGLISELRLVADGHPSKKISNREVIDIRMYNRFNIQAITTQQIRKVSFFLNEVFVKTELHAPYFMFGDDNGAPRYWKNPVLNKQLKIVARADEEVYELLVTFVR